MEFIEKQDIFAGNMMLIDDKGNKITYGDFEDIYEKEEQLLESGTLAFLFCRNAVGSVLYYRICLRKHVVPLLLEHQMDEELLKALLETYEPEYLIGMPEDLKKAGSDGAVMDGSDCFGYRIKKRGPKRRTKLHPDLALLLTTSGSTGSPKLVRQSRKNICANAESIAVYLNLDSSERPITTLPMNYTYGLSIMNSHFEVGAAVLLTEHTLFEREFWEFFREEKATSFGGVPYTYQILKRLNLFDMDLPSLKTMTQAGGKLPVSLHREFAEYAASTGKNFIVMYGQTEATARMSYLPAEDAIRKCGSMGIAIPGGRFRIMEDEKERSQLRIRSGNSYMRARMSRWDTRSARRTLKRETSAAGSCSPGTWRSVMRTDIITLQAAKRGFSRCTGSASTWMRSSRSCADSTGELRSPAPVRMTGCGFI